LRHRHRLKAFAYCDKSEPGLDVESDRVSVPFRDKRTLDLGCGHDERPLSGGFSSTFDEATNSAAFSFTSRPISGDRWRASAFGTGGGGAKMGRRAVTKSKKGVIVPVARPKLTAYVYCR
jgi:hypothetical protein